MDRLEYSYFRECDDGWVRDAERAGSLRRCAALEMGIPLFYSTPDLGLDMPTATWLPLVIEASPWSGGAAPFDSSRIRVLHLPSRRDPPIKGTRHIDPVLRRMHDRGYIDYVAPEFVAHSEMPGLIKSVDVVVEQVMSGSYGVAAVEGMAAGRLVIGYVGEEVRALMPVDPPIQDATPQALEGVLGRILDDRAAAAATAAAGFEFVSALHSGDYSARVISTFVGATKPR